MTIEAAILGSYAALSSLAFRGFKAHPSVTGPIKAISQVWIQVRAICKKPSHISLHTPLWGNPSLPHLYAIPDPYIWAQWGITTLKHIVPDCRILPSQTCNKQTRYPVPWSSATGNWAHYQGSIPEPHCPRIRSCRVLSVLQGHGETPLFSLPPTVHSQ